MSITIEQIKSLGFVPTKKKSPYSKKYDTLIYPLNKNDYLYLGYNGITKGIDFKRLWKSCVDMDGKRVTYQISHLGETSFSELKDYIDRHKEVDG